MARSNSSACAGSETNVFGGLPQTCSAVLASSTSFGATVATFVLHPGVEENFVVQMLPAGCLDLPGPDPDADQSPVICAVPPKLFAML